MMLGMIIPKSWILYGLIAGSILLVLLGVKREIIGATIAKVEAEIDTARLNRLIKEKEARHVTLSKSDADLIRDNSRGL